MNRIGNRWLDALLLSAMLLAAPLACSKKVVETAPPAPPVKAAHTKAEAGAVASTQPFDEAKHVQAGLESLRPRIAANLPKLKKEASVPFQPGEDPRIRSRRTLALIDLARSGTREGVEAAIEVVLSPANEKHWYTAEKLKKDQVEPMDRNAPGFEAEMERQRLYGNYFMRLVDLSKYLEGTPAAREGWMFTVEDLPAWREWWAANKDRLQFKPLPKNPEWMDKALKSN